MHATRRAAVAAELKNRTLSTTIPDSPRPLGSVDGRNFQESMMIKQALVLASLALALGAAHAHNCPNEMKAIDAKLAANPKMADADVAKAKKLRADGEAAHKAGEHDKSMQALAEAKKLLGI